MSRVVELLYRFWDMWAEMFAWMPYGDPYIASSAMLASLIGLGMLIGKFMGTDQH